MKQVKVGDEILLRCRVDNKLGDDISISSVDNPCNFDKLHPVSNVVAILGSNADEVSKINRAFEMNKLIDETCAANAAIIETATKSMNALTKLIQQTLGGVPVETEREPKVGEMCEILWDVFTGQKYPLAGKYNDEPDSFHFITRSGPIYISRAKFRIVDADHEIDEAERMSDVRSDR
jgi:hypothetical protein